MSAELLFRDDTSEVWLGDSLNPDHVAAIMGERVANGVSCGA